MTEMVFRREDVRAFRFVRCGFDAASDCPPVRVARVVVARLTPRLALNPSALLRRLDRRLAARAQLQAVRDDRLFRLK